MKLQCMYTKTISKRFLLIALATFISLSASSFNTGYAKDPSSDDTVKLFGLFGDVFEKIKRKYVEEVSDKQLIEAAINGMLSSLDPHSSYLNEKDFSEMRIQTKGEFGGLGIEVTMENGLVKVVSPIDDTPAYRAGIKSGDYISRIDNDSVMGMNLSDAVDKMRGKPGTKIRLEVLREGTNEPLVFDIKRDIIKIVSVKSDMKSDNVAYLRITSFSENTSSALTKAIAQLKKDSGDKLKGVVLDLRNNPGGLLDQAIEVSDLFLERGEIVSTRGRISDSNKRFNAKPGDVLNGKPIVIIINNGSASASEIVSGALQDHKRAIVIGEKSFGKGSVQTVEPLSEGYGAMRLTTSRYFTPSGKSIQAEGITPDIVVVQAKVESLKPKTIRTSEANLRKHLENNSDKTDQSGTSDDSSSDTTAKPQSVEAKAVGGKTTVDDDYQLSRAIDLIKGLDVFGNKKGI